MGLDLQEIVRDARRRMVHPDAAQAAAAGLGVAFAIGGMEWSSLAVQYPLAFIPFATSIVLVIGSPDVEPAQPRALIGGHIVATLVGFVVLRLAGPQAWASGGLPWTFLLAPVLAGALSLAAFAYLWHRWVLRQPWPSRWL
jgi:CBS-domain-containing membrane protein